MAIDRKNLCPNCGAKLTGLELVCPECGYVLVSETGGGQNTTESLLSLQEKLSAVDKLFAPGTSSSKKKATIINAFPIPNTTESLIRLLHYSYANFEASKEAGDKKLAVAWLGKAVESYRRLNKEKKDPIVSASLEEYSLLDDKKVFSKLSGSRAKKRWIAGSSIAVVALLVAFALWFDWAGVLFKIGKGETAVNLLHFLGRDVEAVSLLAQGGQTRAAIVFAGKMNNADKIHLCVEEIGKYCLLKDRTVFNEVDIEDIKLVGGSCTPDTTFLFYYESDQTLRRKVMQDQKGVCMWYDYLEVMKDYPIPEPCEFVNSYFIADYYSFVMDRNGDPNSLVVRQGARDLITRIELSPLNKIYELYYAGVTGMLIKERVSYKGVPTVEVNYDYGLRGSTISSVKNTFLLSQEEINKRFKKDEAPSPNNVSWTAHYDYTDGRLKRIRYTFDHYNDFLYRFYSFEYYDNVRIRTRTDIDTNTEEEMIAEDVNVEFFLDGKYVESFVVSL